MKHLCSLALFLSCASDPPTTPHSDPAFFTSGDAKLAFALDLPTGTGPFPAVVLAHGSGRVTRDMLRPLALPFVARGYAVLRYDKRGVGQSTGAYRGVSTANSPDMIPLLAADLAAGATFLRAHPSVDKDRVGFAGGSQAGWIIPVAATMVPEARFAVIISGPTISVGRQIYYFDLADGTTATHAELSAALAAYAGPDGFDPLATLESVGLPILWLYGGQDRAVPTPESVAILRTLVDTKQKPFTWKIYPTAGHQLAVDFWPAVDAWLAALP